MVVERDMHTVLKGCTDSIRTSVDNSMLIIIRVSTHDSAHAER